MARGVQERLEAVVAQVTLFIIIINITIIITIIIITIFNPSISTSEYQSSQSLEFFISYQSHFSFADSFFFHFISFILSFAFHVRILYLLTLFISTQVGNIGEEKAQARFAKLFQ